MCLQRVHVDQVELAVGDAEGGLVRLAVARPEQHGRRAGAVLLGDLTGGPAVAVDLGRARTGRSKRVEARSRAGLHTRRVARGGRAGCNAARVLRPTPRRCLARGGRASRDGARVLRPTPRRCLSRGGRASRDGARLLRLTGRGAMGVSGRSDAAENRGGEQRAEKHHRVAFVRIHLISPWLAVVDYSLPTPHWEMRGMGCNSYFTYS